MVTQMREIADTAVSTTRKVRRDVQRRTEASLRPQPAVPSPKPPAPDTSGDDKAVARPFEVIEQW